MQAGGPAAALWEEEVTDAKVAEQEILGLIEAGLDKIDQGVTVFDRDLRLVFANHPLLDLLDIPAELVKPGASFADVVRYNAVRGEYGPGDPEKQVAERVAKARQFETHTLERIRPNGTVLRISGWPLPDGGFATIYTDVTDQRNREARLQKEVSSRTADLRRNEARLRMIANEVPAGIAYLDRGEIFRFANARFAGAYDLTVDSIIGLPARQVLSEQTMEAVQPYFDRAQLGEEVDFDHTLWLPHGRTIEVRTFLRPERDHAETERGFYVLSIYVGRQKRAAEALQQAQKMEALGTLSAGIAHDFNNLLTVILGNLTPLSERLDDSGQRETLLAPALRAARRGADLTKRLLAVARRQPLEPTPVDVPETARTIVELFRRSLPEGVELALNEPAAPAIAYVDRAQLENALLNLAVNARDAVGSTGRIEIDIALRPLEAAQARPLDLAPGDYVEIRCRDDGSGVDKAVTDRVFEPFFTTKADSGGTGLGLSVVYGFVRESDGAISFHSAPGSGTDVRILLPATDDPVEPLQPIDKAELDFAGRYAGLLALLVDDDDEVRRVLRRDLVSMGLGVVEAEGSSDALTLAQTVEKIDVVLTDVAMPGPISGIGLGKQLADLRPDLPIIYITGHGREHVIDSIGKPARTLVLEKPVERRQIAQALDQLLSDRLSALSGADV